MNNSEIKEEVSKKCLVLSSGPVPVPEHPIVEGGGLRCWGLAKGIKQNSPSTDVVVAYHESHLKGVGTKKHQGIGVTTWSMDSIRDLLKDFDSVIVSYCMGDLSTVVADSLRPDQQLILDCYVPIYVEVSARNSSDLNQEYYSFQNDIGRWAHVLRRGDLFLCASEAQKKYYQGVLSAVGRLNPATYGTTMILVVPYGIYRDDSPVARHNPIGELTRGKRVKNILWFGGIYPWFDLRNLVEAVAIVNHTTPVKLIIVGAKNPFNSHPDFLRRYDELVDFIKSKQAYKELVVLQDWVKFEDRADWYLNSDLVVVVNKEGEENKLAWRTRLVDFMWANLPIVTNGGDPLGEHLIQQSAAARFESLEVSSVADSIESLLKDKRTLQKMQESMGRVKEEFYWDVVTKELSTRITNKTRAKDIETFGLIDLITDTQGIKSRTKKIALKARKIPIYAREHGIKMTTKVVASVVKDKVAPKLASKERAPKILFFSHQLDLSGAPTVFIDALTALLQKYDTLPVEFHTWNPTHRDNFVKLNQIGIRPKLHLDKNIGFDYVAGDVVVFNTVAHSPMLRHSTYTALEKNIVTKLIWYIHEDEPELIFDGSEQKTITNLLRNDKITIFIAAQKTLRNYQSYFDNTANIRQQEHRLLFDTKYHKVRSEDDFDKLDIILPGTVGDGRKGQMPILYALAFVQKYIIDNNPKDYRKFSLTYVGMHNDFISRQIKLHASALNGEFRSVGHVSHKQLMELYLKSNMTVCYSMRECLPLFVFEGMITGHPILRNDSSGVDEQLVPGKNGFLLPSDNILLVAEVFEKVLNKKKTPNSSLAKMSKQSYLISKALESKSYDEIVGEIVRSFKREK